MARLETASDGMARGFSWSVSRAVAVPLRKKKARVGDFRPDSGRRRTIALHPCSRWAELAVGRSEQLDREGVRPRTATDCLERRVETEDNIQSEENEDEKSGDDPHDIGVDEEEHEK